ncbi:hypothetical protein B0H14DRAFT_956056 [Mycena olivaceomarginata]|nr:hypothetical protein B0H14DRAFT_956056 [Mycena olivaceomarginata]
MHHSCQCLISNLIPHPLQEHLCTRCVHEVDAAGDKTTLEITLRLVSMSAACLLSITIFGLLVGHFTVGHRPNVLTIFIAVWTDVTATSVLALLIMGRHRKLGRTVTQIRVLSALAVSWIFLLFAMISQESSSDICGWRNYTNCHGLFTAAHVLSWFLMITLFAGAYATYRRAISIHGTGTVPLPGPPMIPAWRLSVVAENQGIGSIKI